MYQPVKGMRDFLPQEMRKREFVLDTVKSVFRTYGYEPLETPALEDFELLAKKGGGGDEIRREIYCFKDQGGREIGMRYDLTVPAARLVATDASLAKPFKRYAIGRVWRYDNPGAGRYREFWQADVDIFGSLRPEADAEVIAVAVACFKALGFKDFTVRLNNRKITEGFLMKQDIPAEKTIDVFRSIDKLEKLGEAVVRKELAEKGIGKKETDEMLRLIRISGGREALKKISAEVSGTIGDEGVKELEAILKKLDAFGAEGSVVIDMSLVRGLDYYTGPVFEVSVEGGKLSVAGGGRFDRLIELYGGRPTPAVGISLGIERIIPVMDEKGMLPQDSGPAKVFVAAAKDEARDTAVEVAQKLRNAGVAAESDLMGRPLVKQFDYCNSKRIPFCAVIGPSEMKEKSVTLRNMATGKEEKVPIAGLAKKLR